jgi:hypothetical protein
MQLVTERCCKEYGIEQEEEKEDLEDAGWRVWKSEHDKCKTTSEKKMANKLKTKNLRRRKQLGQRLIRALVVCLCSLHCTRERVVRSIVCGKEIRDGIHPTRRFSSDPSEWESEFQNYKKVSLSEAVVTAVNLLPRSTWCPHVCRTWKITLPTA